MPPSFYMWSFNLKVWVALEQRDVEHAHEIGFFVIWWEGANKPTKWVYNKVFDKEFHLTADEVDYLGDMRISDLFDEG